MGHTVEIRSREGELWYQRALPVGRVKMLMDEVMSSRVFWAEGWSLIVRPYNEKTDLEPIGNLRFLRYI